MSRAALLVGGPDPFLDAFWLRNFATWRDAVDALYVIICGQYDTDLRDYTRARVAEVGGRLVEFAPALDHGVAIGRVMDQVSEDLVMLCEEDAFVRRTDDVRTAFERIERGEVDVVGCPRSTGTPGIIDLGNARFGQMIAESGEAGPIFWPCFLFAKRADLERTDRNYSVWGCQPGTTVFGHTFTQEQAMDTFGWASLQLRENGARVQVEANFRADLAQMHHWDPGWFHVGSMSTGYGMYICGPGAHKLGLWQHLRNSDLTDWCKRVAFWEILAERGTDMPERRAEYAESVAELVRETGMDRAVIERWKAQFTRFINW